MLVVGEQVFTIDRVHPDFVDKRLGQDFIGTHRARMVSADPGDNRWVELLCPFQDPCRPAGLRSGKRADSNLFGILDQVVEHLRRIEPLVEIGNIQTLRFEQGARIQD